MIKFHCAQCQAKIGVEDRHAGRSLKCPKCGAIARVPTPAPPIPSFPSDNVLAGALELENAARAQARSQDEIVELEPQQASSPIDRPMMLQPPAKLERPMHREKFTLTWWAVLIYLAGAALVTFSYSQQYESFEYWASRAAGAVFGLSMFSLLVSWLVFRASRRSVWLASVIFSALVIMLTLGSFTRGNNNAAGREFAREMQALQSQITMEMSETNVELIKKAAAVANRAASKMTGDESKLALVMATIFQHMAPSMEEVVQAFSKFEKAGMCKPTSFPNQQSIAERIEMLQQYLAAYQRHDVVMANMKQIVSPQIDQIHGHKKEKSILLGLADAMSQRIALNAEARVAERQSVQVMINILNLMSATWGKWKATSAEEIVFERDADLVKYNKLQQELNQSVQNYEKAQTQVMQKLQEHRRAFYQQYGQ